MSISIAPVLGLAVAALVAVLASVGLVVWRIRKRRNRRRRRVTYYMG